MKCVASVVLGVANEMGCLCFHLFMMNDLLTKFKCINNPLFS